MIPGAYIPFLGTEANNEVRLKTNSYSLFGQVDYDLNDQFTFIAGIRGLVEKQSYTRSIVAYMNTDDYRVETDTRVAGSGYDFNGTLRTPFADSRSPTLWTGKVQLDQHRWTLGRHGVRQQLYRCAHSPDRLRCVEPVRLCYLFLRQAPLGGGVAAV
ncbi:MAG: TonB-dependent receptor [Gammaproteobacteria bacterium]|nr:TonB-dependent receptor [Gammaproteobacteria bacterium]